MHNREVAVLNEIRISSTSGFVNRIEKKKKKGSRKVAGGRKHAMLGSHLMTMSQADLTKTCCN